MFANSSMIAPVWEDLVAPTSFDSEELELDNGFFDKSVLNGDNCSGAAIATGGALLPPLDLDLFEQELKKQEEEEESWPEQDFNPMANSSMMVNPADLEPSTKTESDDSAMDTIEGTQNLIDEMEAFLRQHEDDNQPQQQLQADSGIDLLEQVMEEVKIEHPVEQEGNAVAPPLTEEESDQAEAILDALIKGDLVTPMNTNNEETFEIIDETGATIHSSPMAEIKHQPEVVEQQQPQTVLANINNISEVVTADGQKIVIVITNDLPQAKVEETQQQLKQQLKPQMVMQEAKESEEEEEEDAYDGHSDDSDWLPSPKAVVKAVKAATTPRKTKATVGRVAKQRGPYNKRAHASVKDKKQRKKLQNVEAARRYRDKKKLEQCQVEDEEDVLLSKNKKLKSKVAEVENELNTLKKLMTELGLVK